MIITDRLLIDATLYDRSKEPKPLASLRFIVVEADPASGSSSGDGGSSEETNTMESGSAAAGIAVGLSGVAFAVGLAALLDLVSIEEPVAGRSLSVLFGVILLALGVSVITFGVASWQGYVDTGPQPSAGLVAAVAFTAI